MRLGGPLNGLNGSSLGFALPPVLRVVYAAFREDLPPGVTVFSDLSANTVDDLPGLLFDVSMNGSSSDVLGVFQVTLTVHGVGLTDGAAWQAADAGYRVLQSWRQTRMVPGLGGVRYMSNISLPSKVEGQSKVMIGKPVEQFTGVFLLRFFEPPYFHSHK